MSISKILSEIIFPPQIQFEKDVFTTFNIWCKSLGFLKKDIWKQNNLCGAMPKTKRPSEKIVPITTKSFLRKITWNTIDYILWIIIFSDEKSFWAQIPYLKISKRSNNAKNKIHFWKDWSLDNFWNQKMVSLSRFRLHSWFQPLSDSEHRLYKRVSVSCILLRTGSFPKMSFVC